MVAEIFVVRAFREIIAKGARTEADAPYHFVEAMQLTFLRVKQAKISVPVSVLMRQT